MNERVKRKIEDFAKQYEISKYDLIGRAEIGFDVERFVNNELSRIEDKLEAFGFYHRLIAKID